MSISKDIRLFHLFQQRFRHKQENQPYICQHQSTCKKEVFQIRALANLTKIVAQTTYTQPFARPSGGSPVSVGKNLSTSGSSTGKSFSSTA
jgi:hypothetical protein